MRLVTVKMPELYVEILDALVAKGVFSTRSEAIRAAVRELIKKYIHKLSEDSDDNNHANQPEQNGGENSDVKVVRVHG